MIAYLISWLSRAYLAWLWLLPWKAGKVAEAGAVRPIETNYPFY